MSTLLAKKANDTTPIAKDDDTHAQLIADPTVDTTSFSDPHLSIAATDNSAFGSGFSSFVPQPVPASTTVAPNSNTWASAPVNTTPVTNLTQSASSNAASGADILVENTNTDFINTKWRPLMAFLYMATCAMDFIIFPILWSLLQAMTHGNVANQWQPLTLQGAGLYHIAMGAVLGIAAYGRTKEKIEGKN